MIFHSTYSKPILLVGNGVRSAGAESLLRDFVKSTNIPVLTTMNAVDLSQGPSHIGFIGTHGNRIANIILNEADLVVSIGARLGIRQVGKNTSLFAPKADLVRCDIDEFELSRDIKINERKYCCDAKDFIKKLLSEKVGDFFNWKNRCLDAKKRLDKFDIQPGNKLISTISSLLPTDPIVAVDVGMNQCWAAQSLVLNGDNGRILIAGGFGAMGCALPFAIGASISKNKKTVYCIVGDGGFQMNIQELQTVKRENLPIKIFILNNRVLGKISETQHYNFCDRFANTSESGGYTVPEFKLISQAYGIKAVKINSFATELHKYSDWLYDDEPCLFDITLPQASFLTPKIDFKSGKMFPKIDESALNDVKHYLQHND